jgi:SAM-dependent methyltransferase
MEQDDSAVDYFGQQADRWSGLYALKPAFRDRLDLFLTSLVRLTPPPGRVLDFGCGPGVISFAAAARGYEVTGVDGSQPMIAQAEQERARRKLGNVRFSLMSADAFDLPKESFDGAISSSVLQYIPDDRKLLSNLVSVLKPGGSLLISVPHAGSILGWLEPRLHRLSQIGRLEGRGFLKYSQRLYDEDAFLDTLRGLGLGSFETTFFEVPVLGRWGIRMSRIRRVGVMLLVAAKKTA